MKLKLIITLTAFLLFLTGCQSSDSSAYYVEENGMHRVSDTYWARQGSPKSDGASFLGDLIVGAVGLGFEEGVEKPAKKAYKKAFD